MGTHQAKDCKQRKLQHCKDCHIYIRRFSDHSSICANKKWVYDVYYNLYAAIPLERCNIGFNTDVRFYTNENWRKSCEGVDAYSTSSGIYFRFVTDKDLSVYSNSFVHARILIVVKDAEDKLMQKLVLMTSKTKMMIATSMDQPFNCENAMQYEGDTSLILAVSGDCNPVISISVYPKNGLARHHALHYDSAAKEFQVPDELKIGAATSAPTATQPCNTVAVYCRKTIDAMNVTSRSNTPMIMHNNVVRNGILVNVKTRM